MKAGAVIVCLTFAFAAPGISAGEAERAAMLDAHNKWRAGVGVQKLSYSRKLEASAREWANTLKDRNNCRPKHSNPVGRYGENLYWASALMWSDGRREVQQVTPEAVVDSWAAERVDYSRADNKCRQGKVCGHYTQVVWKDTRQVGCAHAVCVDSKEQIWVCQYAPAGNRVGERPY